VKRRVIVGNVSQYLRPDQRPKEKPEVTHRWMVYLTGEKERREEPGTYIRKVRFHLHRDYKPHDVVDVDRPPFHLTRHGWGEFPIRVGIYYRDRLNKPINITHQLLLDQTHSGTQKLGSERTIELNLDRRTKFGDPVAAEKPKEKL
ncbi:MAG: yeats family-domain-containing protein, partial [Piptocephalis tieghemiana]